MQESRTAGVSKVDDCVQQPPPSSSRINNRVKEQEASIATASIASVNNISSGGATTTAVVKEYKEIKKEKIQQALKDFVRKSELLFSLLNDESINNLPRGKTITTKTSYSELENYTRFFKDNIRSSNVKCKWAQDYINLLEFELKDIIEDTPAPILWDEVGNENYKNRIQFFMNGIHLRKANDFMPLIDGTKNGNETEVVMLKGEIVDLTDKLLTLQRDQDINRDVRTNEMVMRHEVQLARWKKDELEWRSKQKVAMSEIDSLNEQLLTMKLKIDKMEIDLKTKDDEIEKLNNNNTQRPAVEANETSFRLLMKQFSSTEARLAKSTTEIETLRAKIIMLQKETNSTPSLDEPQRRRSHNVHISTDDQSDVNNTPVLKDKDNYLKQILRSYIQYTEAGEHDKALLILPAIKAVMNS